jgi:hypothetical protein
MNLGIEHMATSDAVKRQAARSDYGLEHVFRIDTGW